MSDAGEGYAEAQTRMAVYHSFQWPIELILSVMGLPGRPNFAERCKKAQVINLRYSSTAGTQSSSGPVCTDPAELFVQRRITQKQWSTMQREGGWDAEMFGIKGPLQCVAHICTHICRVLLSYSYIK
ncbi:hypothetical protein NQZ68_025662 [Dissostichus eleginoides]|nr:hypothetical protein NQZ68_025662 [Dissostichus eleginoides]